MDLKGFEEKLDLLLNCVINSECGVIFFFSLFLQVLPGFCKANSPESGSQLVQLQSQKSSFQCSSITRVTSARNTQTNKERKKITTAFQQSPFGPRPFLIPGFSPSSLQSQGTLVQFWRLKQFLAIKPGMILKFNSTFLLLLQWSLNDRCKHGKKVTPLHQCAYVCSM